MTKLTRWYPLHDKEEKEMDREIWERLYCRKLSRELEAYKASILEMDKEEIYGAAYEIDSVISIYEFLIETAEDRAEDFLESVIVFPDLLLFLYHKWLDYKDSHTEELERCMNRELIKIQESYKKEEQAA